MDYSLNSEKVAHATEQCLMERGVTKDEIAELVMFLQRDYIPGLTKEKALHTVDQVLAKREVQNALLTGIQLDILAEQGKLMQPLQDMLQNDEPLYGCDEIMALSIVNVYGSIGFTNYGFIDKRKEGVLKRLNDKSSGQIHTFLDDLVGAIAAAASSKIAHGHQAELEEMKPGGALLQNIALTGENEAVKM
ncbi:phosphatidylglycerophosphatase A family protein [Paenibacillus gansuensis]|uniref:Phosphatidylglycerophosphatase A n=1 Tax=Paenibacillus gansuensis TaxID=306542 RepID=A0ABW5PDG5_9BACL